MEKHVPHTRVHTLVRKLCEAGANIEAKDNDGFTPLMLAVSHKMHNPTLVELLNHGANIEAENFGYTPLLLAVEQENHNHAELLVERGAHIEAATADGYTPL
jgi:ankyrin repeat protein